MKHLTSIASTKAEQFLYTDFSIKSLSTNPKHSIAKLISYVRNALRTRVYLCYRDVEQMYALDEQFLSQCLGVGSSEELWGRLAGNGRPEMGEREIVGLFTKIVLSLTREKNQAAEAKRYERFAELKITIQWLEDRILEIEQVIRDRVKEEAVKKRLLLQKKKQIQFHNEVQEIKHSLQLAGIHDSKNLTSKHKAEKKRLSQTVQAKIQNQSFLYKPSKKLQDAKDTSLLAKLAPYKSEKKRPFECRSLQKSLSITVQQGKQHTEKQIENYKRTQIQKLKSRHSLEKDSFLFKFENQKNLTLAKLEIRKDQLSKAERIKMNRLVQENNRATKQRVMSLRNSLRAFSLRDEQRQISSIMKNHRETIQFVNDLEIIGQTQKHAYQPSGRYSTMDLESQWTKETRQKRYSELRMEGKILRKVKNESPSRQNREDQAGTTLQSARRSLVDLYDQQLKQIC